MSTAQGGVAWSTSSVQAVLAGQDAERLHEAPATRRPPEHGPRAAVASIVLLGHGDRGSDILIAMTATVHDAVEESRRVLESRGDADLIDEMDVAYALIAGEPLSRVRVPSVHHVDALMSEIQSDESMDVATNNAATTLHLRIANAIGVVNTRLEPEPDPGVPRDHEGRTYRVDGANVLHFEVRDDDNLIIHALHIRVAPSGDDGPTPWWPRPPDLCTGCMTLPT
jgi:hypothetical protein